MTTWQNELNHEWHSPEEVDDMIDRADDAKLQAEEDRMQRALSQADRILSCGWRVVLRAEQHVMKDLGWDWHVRFETSGFLWRHALQLCKDRILGENQ